MKVLSLTQPWASLLAFDEKRWETRSWSTQHRGPLAIAASKGFPRACQMLCGRGAFAAVFRRHGIDTFAQLPLGKILCVVDVLAVVSTNDIDRIDPKAIREHTPPASALEDAFGDYGPNRYVWMTRNVRRLTTPIPAIGRLGLWDHDVIDPADAEPDHYPDMCEISGCPGCIECEPPEDREHREVCGVCRNLRVNCCCDPDDGMSEEQEST